MKRILVFPLFLTFLHLFLVSFSWADDASKGFVLLRQMQGALVNLAEQVRPTVVTINPHVESSIKKNKPRSMRRVRPTNTGTGVIIDGKKGLIVTNSHVVRGFDNLDVTLFEGKVLNGRVLGMDEETDLAVVRVESDRDLPEAKLGDSKKLNVGQIVVAVGNPFGLNSTMTMGVVSGLNRENVNISRYEDFIQTDASINPGNSGGPLLNIDGEVVGINTAIINYAQNIGFSIPSNMVKEVAKDLIENGEVQRGWLGVGIEEVSDEIALEWKIPEGIGVYVNAVFEGDPGDKAGLKVGDVILKIGGAKVDSPGSLIRLIGSISPGQKVNLDILRDGGEKLIPVLMGFFKKASQVASVSRRTSPRSLGFLVNNLRAELANKYRIEEKTGVIVTDIFPNGLASNGGLREGDMVLALNGKKIHSRQQFNKLVGRLERNETIYLLVQRGGEPHRVEMSRKDN